MIDLPSQPGASASRFNPAVERLRPQSVTNFPAHRLKIDFSKMGIDFAHPLVIDSSKMVIDFYAPVSSKPPDGA